MTVYNKNTAAAYFGTGNGSGNFVFQSLFWSPAYDVVVAQDVNGDGKSDVALYDSATGTEYTGVSNGDGTFVIRIRCGGRGRYWRGDTPSMRISLLKLALLLGFVCAASAQNILNMSQDLVRLGIAATNMVPNEPALDAGPLFMQAVSYAKQHGITP